MGRHEITGGKLTKFRHSHYDWKFILLGPSLGEQILKSVVLCAVVCAVNVPTHVSTLASSN